MKAPLMVKTLQDRTSDKVPSCGVTQIFRVTPIPLGVSVIIMAFCISIMSEISNVILMTCIE